MKRKLLVTVSVLALIATSTMADPAFAKRKKNKNRGQQQTSQEERSGRSRSTPIVIVLPREGASKPLAAGYTLDSTGSIKDSSGTVVAVLQNTGVFTNTAGTPYSRNMQLRLLGLMGYLEITDTASANTSTDTSSTNTGSTTASTTTPASSTTTTTAAGTGGQNTSSSTGGTGSSSTSSVKETASSSGATVKETAASGTSGNSGGSSSTTGSASSGGTSYADTNKTTTSGSSSGTNTASSYGSGTQTTSGGTSYADTKGTTSTSTSASKPATTTASSGNGSSGSTKSTTSGNNAYTGGGSEFTMANPTTTNRAPVASQPTSSYVALFGDDANDDNAQPVGPTGNFKITFRDEFNENGLNSNKWIRQLPWFEDPSIENFRVEEGVLKIWTPRDSNGNFITQNRDINTSSKFYQTYGFYEMNARIPRGHGLWPSFWLYADSGADRPEIDILETFTGLDSSWGDDQGRPTDYGATLHMADSVGKNAVMKGHQRLSHSLGSQDITSAFHTYGALWEPDGLTFYFDGTPLGPKIMTTEFNRDMFVILGMGPNHTANETTPDTIDGAYQVNYVRVWALPQ